MHIITRWAAFRSALAALGVLATIGGSAAAAQVTTPAGPATSFRGLDIAPDGTIWASGTGGMVLRSTDGASWDALPIADAESFDLRDVEAISVTTAYAMVAGADTARIYKTTDGGRQWVRQYDDTRKGIFLDGITFWDEARGVAFGDPMDGQFVILRTEDGGAHWTQVPSQDALQAQKGEAAFAASGSFLTSGPDGRAWIGTGANEGAGVGRLLRSADYGRSWTAGNTPIPAGIGSAGIFSVAFRDSLHGVVAGGDYQMPDADRANVAITADGGKTWTLGDTTGVTGYLSAVAYVPAAGPQALVAAGTVGMFASADGGRTWRRLNADSYNAVAAGKGITAVGDDGRVGVWPSLEAAQDKAVGPLRRRPAP